MIPIMLDPSKLSIGLVGRGGLTTGRLSWLRDGGAETIVFSDQPEASLVREAGGALVRRLPSETDLARLSVLWIADLPEEQAEPLVNAARRAGVLVNWEDVKPACDFHNPALVRRGDLLLSISTGGKSPGLASRLRRMFEAMFGDEWQGRLDKIAAKRIEWKQTSPDLDELAHLTNAFVDRKEWLPPEAPEARQ